MHTHVGACTGQIVDGNTGKKIVVVYDNPSSLQRKEKSYSEAQIRAKFGGHARFVTCCLARQPSDDPKRPAKAIKSVTIFNNQCPCKKYNAPEFDGM